MLIQQLSTSRHVATDRFYRTLYESLLDPRLSTSSKQTLYLNLLSYAQDRLAMVVDLVDGTDLLSLTIQMESPDPPDTLH